MRPKLLAAALTATTLAAAVGAAPAAAQPACGDTLTQDTTLTADLSCPSAAGLTIGAPGIVVDLGGHRISTGSVAIRNDGFDGVTIRNGMLDGGSGGALLTDAADNTIRDVEVDATTTGIWLRRSPGARILSSSFRSAALLVHEGSDGTLVRDSLFTAFEGFLNINGSSDSRVVHNTFWTSRQQPIGLSDAHRNVIRHNAFVNQLSDLMSLRNSNDNVISDNAFAQYGPYARGRAVAVTDSSRNRFRDNTFAGSPVGFAIASGADNVFAGNTLSGAVVPLFDEQDPDGFVVAAAATGTVLRDNRVERFEDDGIDVEAPGTLIKRNTANDNGDLGIEAVVGVVDGGGNHASGNGNPLQCVSVFCAP
jgi:parallel beta-helix repeat protein